MKALLKSLLLLLFLSAAIKGNAQTINQALLKGSWKAAWITLPGESLKDYGVYYFRKSINLKDKPESFVVHVSADNRYKLYVNQTLVSLGPARGDTYYWNYETVDLAPYLKAGINTIAALVWNEGDYRPEAQISLQTGFIMQGDSEAEAVVNTDKTWKGIRSLAYKPLTGIGFHPYYVAGPGERIDMNQGINNWDATSFDDSTWKNAIKIDNGNTKGTVNAFGWMLVPSAIPPVELTMQRIPVLRKADGVNVPKTFPATKTALTIPANTTATLLLDQTFLTNAYVTLNFSKGKNAGISLSYAEAMFTKLNPNGEWEKGNRDKVEGHVFAGRKDSIISNGDNGQSFTTLAFRTYRYIQLQVKTGSEPLIIDDLYGTFTGYPFQLNAKFNGSPEMQKMLDIGWRTARLCAWETYTDCPYYEQLQYVGDTRIQALVSYYNSGDDRLVRNAINLMDHSRLAEGITLSRHPSFSPQIISTFSLWYIGMLHDYWMYRPDSAFVQSKMQGVEDILAFFRKYQQPGGSLKNTPYWNFADWVGGKGWDFGAAPVSAKGSSALLDMQLMWAYQQAAEMEAKLGGMPVLAQYYAAMAERLKQTIQQKYWVADKQLYSDVEDQQLFSQHTNSLAILTGMVTGDEAHALGKKLMADSTLTQCTIYFKYYLHQALIKAGFGDSYMSWLDIWRRNIKMGLTTWAEISDLEHNRSDCHAWGASPNIEFYRTVLGIDSYAPGFSEVKIEPHLGNLKIAGGEIPHPKGKIVVKYEFKKGKWGVDITLPKNTSGIFIWNAQKYTIKSGKNLFFIKNEPKT